MASSNAHSPLRLELRRSVLRQGSLLLLLLLAGLALWQASLIWPLAVLLLLAGVVLTAREARRALPVRLRITEADVIWLDWPDGSESAVELVTWRRVGGWLVLRLLDGRRSVWIDCWPDSLTAADRKALVRRLSGSLSSARPV